MQTERRQTQMELDEKRPERVGGLLKNALGNTTGGNKNLGSFMCVFQSLLRQFPPRLI